MLKNKDLDPGFIRDQKLIRELANGTDRSKVIVGTAVVEELLERLLRKSLVQNKKALESSFETANGFLSNFSSKTKASLLFGLISEELYHDIEIIRKIRNHFAHNILNCDFQNKEVYQLCHNFQFAKSAFKTDWNKQPSSLLFIMEIVVVEIVLIKKITRAIPTNNLDMETANLGFEPLDWDYLNGKVN